MYKKVYRLMSAFLAFILAFGGYYSVRAVSALPSQNLVNGVQAWSVTKSYIVDKGNIGGKGCSDTWPGTVDQPLCTVTAGLALIKAGEGLFLRAGTYPSFVVAKSGTNSAYLSIAAYNGEKAIISGGGEAILLKGVSYVRIYGLDVTGATNSYGAGIHVMPNSGAVPMYNIIENNVVHDNVATNTMGILVEDGSFNKIINNKVYNNYLSGIEVLSHSSISPNGITGNEISGNVSYNNVLGGGNADGIKLEGSGTKNTLVMNNSVYGNSDDGIDTWNSSNNTLVGNVSHGQTGPGDGNGFKLGGGTGGYNIIKQNVSYGNKLNGFDTNGTGGDVFYNNVAYNNGNFGFEDGWKDSPCTPSSCQEIFINNIGYNNVRGNFSASAFTMVSHNNVWYSDGGSAGVFYNYSAYSSLSAFYAASGNRLDNPVGNEQASLQTTPLFTNAPAGTFTLQSSSPAIDHGDPANPGQITAVNRVDIGAFENASSFTSTPIPSTQTTVITYTSTATLAAPSATQTIAPSTATPTATLSAALPTPTLVAITATATLAAVNPPAAETIYDDKASGFTYSAGWQDVRKKQAYGNSFKSTSQNGASVIFPFTGQSFSILYKSDPTYGDMEVYIDDVLAGLIQEKSTSSTFQVRWDYPGLLTPGAHILKLVFVSQDATNSTYESIDAVIVR